MNNRLGIIGAGGHAKVVIDAIEAGANEWSIVGLFDDAAGRHGEMVLGYSVLGDTSLKELRTHGLAAIFVAIGENSVREQIVRRLEPWFHWPTIIHPNAFVSRHATIEKGSLVCAGATIQVAARIGRFAIINTAASVDHDCVIEDFTHLGPGVHLGGSVSIAEGGFLGVGASVLPSLSVGKWSLVGAGSVVTRSVGQYLTVVGSPAKPHDLALPKTVGSSQIT